MILPLTRTPRAVDIIAQQQPVSREPACLRVVADTGISMAHLAPLRRFAQRHRIVLGIRKVEASATRLIERGFQTKNFHIKGKSSNWGPMSGLIPINQALSKLVDANPTRIAKANAETEACLGKRLGIADPFAPAYLTEPEGRARIVAGPLILSDDGLRELELADPGLSFNAHPPREKERIAIHATPEATGQLHVFSGERTDDGRWLIRFHGVGRAASSREGEVVEVICYELREPPLSPLDPRRHRASSREDRFVLHPVTADYDLLLFGPELSDYGAQDTRPLVHASEREFSRMRGPAGRRLEPYLATEDPGLGNCSQRLRAFLPMLNDELSDGTYRPLFHHSDDANSPFTDPRANFPALVVYPSTEPDAEEGAFEVVSDAEAFSSRFDHLKERFAVFWHPEWTTEPVGPRADYVAARRRFEAPTQLCPSRGDLPHSSNSAKTGKSLGKTDS